MSKAQSQEQCAYVLNASIWLAFCWLSISCHYFPQFCGPERACLQESGHQSKHLILTCTATPQKITVQAPRFFRQISAWFHSKLTQDMY